LRGEITVCVFNHAQQVREVALVDELGETTSFNQKLQGFARIEIRERRGDLAQSYDSIEI